MYTNGLTIKQVWPRSLNHTHLSRLQEKHIREKLRDYLKSIVAMQQDLKEVQGKVIKMESKITNTHKRQERLLESSAR